MKRNVFQVFKGLYPIDRLLDFGIEILQAKTYARETEIKKRLKVRCGCIVRMSFEAEVILVVHNSFFEQVGDKPFQIIRTKECWSSTAEM